MAHIPKDAQWFLAALVEEIRVAGSRRNVVHLNYVLIQAASPEEAYSRSVQAGNEGTQSYVNAAGKQVSVEFRGLRSLDVIHDSVEHGCEIMFVEKVGVSEAGIQKMVKHKEQLEVFQPVRRRPGQPDYAAKEIVEELHRRLGDKPSMLLAKPTRGRGGGSDPLAGQHGVD